jgi:hypothetical protein
MSVGISHRLEVPTGPGAEGQKLYHGWKWHIHRGLAKLCVSGNDGRRQRLDRMLCE